ncbi:hypothetical protein DFJ74DRAFT_733251 [Hyaloraphidium curvatum]|nr:hypothetical protein DFJ74DRAFT_733251 [Hyaloraphidium curvatum]
MAGHTAEDGVSRPFLHLPDLVVERVLTFLEAGARRSAVPAPDTRLTAADEQRAANRALANASLVCSQWASLARSALWRTLRPVSLRSWEVQAVILGVDRQIRRTDPALGGRGKPGVLDDVWRAGYSPIPPAFVLDFSAAENIFCPEMLEKLASFGWTDHGTLREIHFPQWDRQIRMHDAAFTGPGVLVDFFRAVHRSGREAVAAAPTGNEAAPRTLPFSNLRVITFPVAWEWSADLHDIVSDRLLAVVGEFCPRLEEVRAMGGDRVTPAGVAALVDGCGPSLRMLRIWKSPAQTDGTLCHVAERCPALRDFSVSFAPAVTPDGLATILALPHLEALDMTCSRGILFRRTLADAFARTQAYTKLRRLDLSIDFWELDELEMSFDGRPDPTLGDPSDLERELRPLLSSLGLDASQPTHLSAPLSATPASHQAALLKLHTYAHIALFSSLEVLVLSGHSALTDARCRALFAPRGGLRSLRRLGLGSCSRLTDAGIAWIAEHGPPALEQLEMLRMGDEVTDATLARIGERWGATLEVLEISECPGFTAAGLDSLANLLKPDCKLGTVALPCSPAFRERFRNPRAGPGGTVFGWIDWALVEFPALAGLPEEEGWEEGDAVWLQEEGVEDEDGGEGAEDDDDVVWLGADGAQDGAGAGGGLQWALVGADSDADDADWAPGVEEVDGEWDGEE